MISLKKRLFQIVVISAAAIAAVVGGAAILFNSLQNKWNYDQTVMHMEAHLSEQQPEIATSYLIPEQSAGRSLLLEKYIKAENLISASILDLLDPIPVEFSHCAKSNSFSNCKSTKGDQIAVIAPISESRTTFGHLLKVSSAKSNGSWIFQIVSTMFVTIALVVAMVLFLLSRVYSRVVFSLNALEEWTRTAVFGKTMDTSEKVDFREIQT
ncbi:MAG: hypothetical protein K2X47_19330, partial [Bdellovibrionales bacterium]|nr:hypothetical protein [Bdellovibrionales bacterium]